MTGWATGLVRCCQCGQPTTAGATDWRGRFRCEDCARAWDAVERTRKRQHAHDAETQRLASVLREMAEREAMWATATDFDG